MSGTNKPNDYVNSYIQKHDLSYHIEVCQGPDCTGLGGGAAILEIEELVREHRYQNGEETITVVVGGCRDFCSVGPNVHVHVRKKGKRKTNQILESFQGVNDASNCNRVLDSVISHRSSSTTESTVDTIQKPSLASSSTVDRHRSMMARRAERQRWGALKDVSRTIAKCQKTVSSTPDADGIERKQNVWKETCRDRLHQYAASSTTTQSQPREKRRVEHLVEIASEKIDRICRQNDDDDDDDSDSSSYTSSSSEE